MAHNQKHIICNRKKNMDSNIIINTRLSVINGQRKRLRFTRVGSKFKPSNKKMWLMSFVVILCCRYSLNVVIVRKSAMVFVTDSTNISAKLATIFAEVKGWISICSTKGAHVCHIAS